MTAICESSDTATLQSLGIDRLPLAVIRQLHLELSALIANTPTDIAPLSEEQRAELRRRVADDDANPDDTIPWEVIKEEMNQRWGWNQCVTVSAE